MASEQCSLLVDLDRRGLIAQQSGENELAAHLNAAPRSAYAGFDPTADSLHIGSLVPLLALRRFQLAGHKPIALVGGATGLIGDPSFKTQERKLNTADVVADWVDKIRVQLCQFIDFDEGSNGALVVNNLDWMQSMDVLSFLRDVGKHFSVNAMIQKESVKQRIVREGAGISFTEFTYMLLQSYDYAELNKRYDCTLQLGGSDQWGNITGGIDLTRRMNRAQVFGLTLPLVTKADGSKFGKTETGTVWLDANKTSQYAFYQFWINSADADVYRFLRYFTFLSPAQIEQIEDEDNQRQGRPQAQSILAAQVTELVHGSEGLEAAKRITEAMFSGSIDRLSETDLEQLKLDGLPSSTLQRSELAELPLTQLLSDSGMVASGKQAKDALGRGAILINGLSKTMADNFKVMDCFARQASLYDRFYIVKLGKKKYHLFEVR